MSGYEAEQRLGAAPHFETAARAEDRRDEPVAWPTAALLIVAGSAVLWYAIAALVGRFLG